MRAGDRALSLHIRARMRRYLILGLFFVFSVSATVLLVSLLKLIRMRSDRFGARRHRRRSPMSVLRARFQSHESLRGHSAGPLSSVVTPQSAPRRRSHYVGT